MRTLRNIFLFFALLAVVLIAICTGLMRVQASTQPGDVTGRNLVTQSRALTAEAVVVEMDGAVDVTLHQGPLPKIEVRAEQRMLPKITTTQDGNTLRIDTRGLIIGSTQPMQVDVTLPALQKVRQHGSGDAKISGFSGDKIELVMQGSGEMHVDGQFKQIGARVQGSGDLQLAGGNSDQIGLQVAGSGNVNATGVTKTIQIRISGSGDVDTSKLQADQLALDIDGSGNGNVHARQAVKVTIRGSGDVTVHGAPVHREVNNAGSGDISFE
jgi:hypothetical protein